MPRWIVVIAALGIACAVPVILRNASSGEYNIARICRNLPPMTNLLDAHPFNDASLNVHELAPTIEDPALSLVPPYDDSLVMAGQGTATLELAR